MNEEQFRQEIHLNLLEQRPKGWILDSLTWVLDILYNGVFDEIYKELVNDVNPCEEVKK